MSGTKPGHDELKSVIDMSELTKICPTSDVAEIP